GPIAGEVGYDIGQERAWIEAAGRDPLAFELLYNRYLPRVYAYVYHRVGDREHSEDLVADTFMKAAQALVAGRFQWRHEGSFAAWLFRIAHNAISDFDRRNQRWSRLVPLEDAADSQIDSNTVLPEAAIMQKEEASHLRHLIS